MAGGDYRSCDVCGGKVFYDAHLNYDVSTRTTTIPPEKMAREAGVPQPYGYSLDHLGDWAVICNGCSKTHKAVVVPLEWTPQKD